MKKYFILFTLSLGLISCSRERLSLDKAPETARDAACNGEMVTLTLTQNATKATLDGLQVKWETGDLVDINGIQYPISVNGSSVTVAVPVAATYNGFYPAGILDGGTAYVQPAQYYAEGSFGKQALPLCASSSTTTLDFVAPMGVLKLNVKGSGNVASISVRDNAAGKVCGTYSVSGTTVTPSAGISFSDVTLNCKTTKNTGVALAAGGTTFYIVLPARTYANGLTITITTVDCHAMVLESATPRTITAGGLLTTPDINFSIPADQIFAYPFDGLTLGADPVAGVKGFAAPDLATISGFEDHLTGITAAASTAGSNVIEVGGGTRNYKATSPYIYSRNLHLLTGSNALTQAQEFHGYLGCGASGSTAGMLKIRGFNNLPSGVVCKAEVEMDIAFQEDASLADINFVVAYSYPGKMLELWVDGVKKADYTPGSGTGKMDDTARWSSSQTGTTGVGSSTHSVEWVRYLRSDASNLKWHHVKLVMGAVTNITRLQICPTVTSGTTAAFFIDNITARRIDYPGRVGEYLAPSLLVNGASGTALDRIAKYTKNLGFTEWIDLYLQYSYFLDESGNPKDDIASKISSLKTQLDDAGYKVWDIHMPATDYAGSYDTDTFEYFSSSSSVRSQAVSLTEQMMDYVKPLESKYLLIHATGPGRDSYYYALNKSYGVSCFKSLVQYCNSSAMQYSDGSHPILCIENIQNTGTNKYHICGSPDYMNYYCDTVNSDLGLTSSPNRLMVGFDASHAQVGSGKTAVEYLAALGNRVAVVHMHGSGKTDVDRHLYPGYANGIYTDGDNDIINWGSLYNTLVNTCGYNGPFSYEISSYAQDCIASYVNVAHNYYDYVLARR